MRLGELGQSGTNGFNMQASYDSMFGSPITSTSSTSTNTTPSSGSASTPANMSTADLNALFGSASALAPQGSDPLAALGSPQYVTPSAGTPAPSSDLSLIGTTISQAGKLFQYVSGVDAQGNPAAVAQQVQSTPASGLAGLTSNPMALLLIGGIALMMLRK